MARKRQSARAALALAALLGGAACGGGARGAAGPEKAFPPGFRLGAATSAHQVEGGQRNNWTLWETLPQFAGRTKEPSGVAADHYHRYPEDLDWVRWMGLDAYRLSIEWSRIEPERGAYDAAEIAHYRAVFEAMRARGIRPSVTLHHFTEPTWFTDLASMTADTNASFCPGGPTEDRFCFWGDPRAPEVFGAFCGLAADAYGAYVDEWWTFNELTGYWLTTSALGQFPPGLTATSDAAIRDRALPVLRGLMDAHAACYRAIHARDLWDADGDGVAARVGLTTGAGPVRPSDPDDPAAVAAAAQGESLAAYLAFDAAESGLLDADFDGAPEEPHAAWAGTQDLLGLQYYASTVAIPLAILPPLQGTPCVNLEISVGVPELDAFLTDLLADLLLALGCPAAPTQDFPLGPEPPGRLYGRQNDPEGLVEMLEKLAARYPGRPLVITENGFADDDEKRASSLVRHLAAAHEALARGVPLEGYYHWSLLDNFEWGRGFDVRFGLLRVDYAGGLARTPTAAAEVYREIAGLRGLTRAMLDARGGSGPLP